VSNFDPNAPGSQQPWGAPPPGGPPPAGGWGAPPGPGPQPYGGQQLPPYSQYGSSQSNWAPTPNPAGELAQWPQRALGWLVDAVFVLVPYIVLYIIGASSGAKALILIGWLWAAAVSIWFAIQVGQVGSSPGMRVIGLKCISKNSGQPIGGGLGFVRSLAHIVDSIICYVGWLFPLWDSQRQTLADKIMSTVVIKVPAQAFSLVPPSN
jgi:uncharacterized RDD family membrane protein YckC